MPGEEIEDLKKSIRAILISTQNNLTGSEISSIYQELMFTEIPLKKHGFETLDGLICNFPSIAIPVSVINKKIVYSAVSNSATQHIAEMVNKQKKSLYKPQRRQIQNNNFTARNRPLNTRNCIQHFTSLNARYSEPKQHIPTYKNLYLPNNNKIIQSTITPKKDYHTIPIHPYPKPTINYYKTTQFKNINNMSTNIFPSTQYPTIIEKINPVDKPCKFCRVIFSDYLGGSQNHDENITSAGDIIIKVYKGICDPINKNPITLEEILGENEIVKIKYEACDTKELTMRFLQHIKLYPHGVRLKSFIKNYMKQHNRINLNDYCAE
ncbi:hypothetical protein MXB_3537, partial [Myxobolus squamalis]